MATRTIYLASASPRRRELVRTLGVPVVAGSAPFDEEAASAEYTGDPMHLAQHLARAKAQATLRAHADELPANAIVVAADTTVVLDGQALGKPVDAAEACYMLTQVRNRRHQVVTGVAVAPVVNAHHASSASIQPVHSLSVTTQVRMRDYTDQEIASYVASGDPTDKAGAYAIQHAEFHPVAAIEGCYLSVVGLPLCALTYLLATAEGATAADEMRSSEQDAAAQSHRCLWSTMCRKPLPRWPMPAGDCGRDPTPHAR
jgi:septum formation protein